MSIQVIKNITWKTFLPITLILQYLGFLPTLSTTFFCFPWSTFLSNSDFCCLIRALTPKILDLTWTSLFPPTSNNVLVHLRLFSRVMGVFLPRENREVIEAFFFRLILHCDELLHSVNH